MSGRHAYREDRAVLPRTGRETGDLPLFRPWPEAPRASVEQRVLPIAGTLEAAYQAWRATPEGELLYRSFCRQALELMAAGATRLSGKAIAESIRYIRRRPINNSHIALMVRDCETDHPVTRCFEKRMRRAS